MTPFEQLHRPGDPLVLANVWDVLSARLVASLGAAAVATTSAGVAWAHGARDGEHLSRQQLVDTVTRIVAAVPVPVTADIEGGYGTSPSEVAQTVHAIVAAGVAGVNLEDSNHEGGGLHSVALQCARIEAARRAAEKNAVPLFLNARVDTYVRSQGDPATRLADTISRAAAYLRAGADGIFVIGADVEVVTALIQAVDAPINVLAEAGGPTVAQWAALGVARISTGPALAQIAYAAAHEAARQLLATGRTGALGASLGYTRLNDLANDDAGAVMG